MNTGEPREPNRISAPFRSSKGRESVAVSGLIDEAISANARAGLILETQD